jgi:hypothetical protein
MATVGQPFELGYWLYLHTDTAAANFMHTITIDFDIPNGYALTSVHGWTPPTAIPLPAAGWLLVSALVGLRVSARRTRRACMP